MTPEETIRLAAVDVRERPEDEVVTAHETGPGNPPYAWTGKGFLASEEEGDQTLSFDAETYAMLLDAVRNDRIRQLEQERDEAVAAWRKESDWGFHAEGLLRQWAELDWLVDTKESTYVAPEDETWEVLRETRAFLAKHPQPAKEQVE
jgi:hypothetical protein